MRGERGSMENGRRDLSILPAFIFFIPGFKALGVGSSSRPQTCQSHFPALLRIPAFVCTGPAPEVT